MKTGELFISVATQNVFEVSKVTANKVRLERIGFITSDGFVESLGIPATVSIEWMKTTDTMIPAVRCFGNVVMSQDSYLQSQEASHD